MNNTSEIKEEDEDTLYTIDADTQKQRIKRIIEYQKSLLSSSSSSSFSSSFSINISAPSSSFSSSSKSKSLLELMKGGNTSLRRLFDMEHTSLSNHFNDYSGSPTIKPILLWDSDTENGFYTSASWRSIKLLKLISSDFGSDGLSGFASDGSILVGESDIVDRGRKRKQKTKLIRTKSFRILPGFGLWKLKGFRLRLRLKKLKIMICGRKC